jgi:ATP:corrinoid adenosyltransferase
MISDDAVKNAKIMNNEFKKRFLSGKLTTDTVFTELILTTNYCFAMLEEIIKYIEAKEKNQTCVITKIKNKKSVNKK